MLVSSPAHSLRGVYQEFETSTHLAAVQVLRGLPVDGAGRRLLARGAASAKPWGDRLVLCLCAAKLALRENRVEAAARALALGREAYTGFVRLQRHTGSTRTPALMQDYVDQCAHVLGLFEPPVPAGSAPERVLWRLARLLPARRPSPPQRVIDALDVVLTAGHALDNVDVPNLLAEGLASMLGARILLHRVGRQMRRSEDQRRHTLSSWTLWRLGRVRRLQRWRVRAAPEFWRPEQRRPRGLLSVPVPDGLLVLARGRRFRPREERAVATVLRFLNARLAPGARPHPSRPAPALPQPLPPSVGEGLLGASPAWRDVLAQVGRLAPSTCSVVLLGESGSGKERLARALHACSPRATGPFVAVNCGALPPELVASELFGHIRGAFTGADRSRDGLLVQAHGGTLFLDELAEAPPALQVALLRALEERRVTPVGSVRPRDVDVRVLAATNADMEARVHTGRFREDLWHRLNVVTLRVPPLRERLADLPTFAAHMLARSGEGRRLHPDALEALSRYTWPGNVRELENVLRAASLLAEGPLISADLVERLLEGRRAARSAAAPVPNVAARAEAILAAVSERWLSSAEIARAVGSSQRTVNREVTRLLAQGLLTASGAARASRYRADAARRRDLSGSGSPRPGSA